MTDDQRPRPLTSPELLHGTLDALILKTLAAGRSHGYAIARAIEQATEWGLSELGRRAKFYRLTPKGRRHLTAQTAEWARFATAISRVLLTT